MGTFTTVFKISWRSIWRRKRRSAITLSAVAFGLALAVFFLAFGDGVYEQMIHDAVRLHGGNFTLEHPEYREAPAIDLSIENVSSLRRRLEQMKGVEKTKVLILGQGVAKSGSGAAGVAVIGVEPEVEAGTSPVSLKIVEGEYLSKDDDRKIVIGAKLAERLKLRLGSKVVLSGNDAHGQLSEELLRVKGLFRLGADETDSFLVQVPIGFARRLYALEDDTATQLGAILNNGDRRDQLMESARRMAPKNVAVRTWEEVLPDLAAYIRVDGGSNMVFQAIIIFLSLFTIFNTILMSVLERTRDFAVQLALGTPPRLLRLQILTESALLGALGVLVGLAIGGSAAYAMQVYGFDLSVFYEEGVSVSGFAIDTRVYAKLTSGLLVWLGSLVFAATVLISLVPMRHIARIGITDVLR